MKPGERATTIAEYNAERDAALIEGIDALRALAKKYDIDLPERSIEITFHKTRTGIVSLPKELRQASYRWLRERGYSTLDDGDLNEFG